MAKELRCTVGVRQCFEFYANLGSAALSINELKTVLRKIGGVLHVKME